ncbi:hypothetical protein [Xanthovirga aplysinae]|uniref:hypothetical protein n=1 Tax=Xanthovirga aplysinae TaxID=2529853 RepID=UPI0012BB7F24|nr:hypothetical protein [Xanthovirga aplysinae]MTI30143.1 hypothetical protein [Xanthovirga aplysinae]
MRATLYLFSFLILVLGFSFTLQKSDEIQKITFKSGTRGFHKELIFTPDSIHIRTSGRSQKEYKGKISKKEWRNLCKSLERVNLVEIPQLQSPTNLRATDRAFSSRLSIQSDGKEYKSSQFDDYNPNEKLKNLALTIQEIEKGKTLIKSE